MNIVMQEYNKFADKPLSTIKDLENVSEILFIETVSETKTEIVYKLFCSCCARDNEKCLHPIHYFNIDVGEIEENGDVGELTTKEYGLL